MADVFPLFSVLYPRLAVSYTLHLHGASGMNYLNYFSSPYNHTVVYAPQPSYSMMHSGSAGSSNYAAAPTPLPTCVSPQALHRPSSQWSGPSSGSKRRHSVTPPTGDPYNVADPSNSHVRFFQCISFRNMSLMILSIEKNKVFQCSYTATWNDAA